MRKQKSLKILLFVNLFSLVGYYVFAPLYGIFARGFSVVPRDIALLWGGYSMLTALFIFLFGKIENHQKKGRMVVLGYVIYAVGALLFLTVHSEKALVEVLAFNALGAGVTLPAYKTLYAKYESHGRESEQWAWLDAGNLFAAGLGGVLGGIVIGAFGFRGIFITMASIQLVAAAVAYRSLYSLV